MPSLMDLIQRLSFLAAMPAVAGIFFCTLTLVTSRDWRIHVIVLAAQFLLLGLLFTRLIRPEVAAVKALIGWLVCLAIYLTARYTGSSDTTTRPRRPIWQVLLPPDAAFRLLAALMMTVAAYTAALRVPLPQIDRDLSLACYLLALQGLLMIGLTEAPLRVGIGLVTLLSGFDLFYSALEPSLVVAGLLGVVNFGIILAASYLETAQSEPAEEGAA